MLFRWLYGAKANIKRVINGHDSVKIYFYNRKSPVIHDIIPEWHRISVSSMHRHPSAHRTQIDSFAAQLNQLTRSGLIHIQADNAINIKSVIIIPKIIHTFSFLSTNGQTDYPQCRVGIILLGSNILRSTVYIIKIRAIIVNIVVIGNLVSNYGV